MSMPSQCTCREAIPEEKAFCRIQDTKYIRENRSGFQRKLPSNCWICVLHTMCSNWTLCTYCYMQLTPSPDAPISSQTFLKRTPLFLIPVWDSCRISRLLGCLWENSTSHGQPASLKWRRLMNFLHLIILQPHRLSLKQEQLTLCIFISAGIYTSNLTELFTLSCRFSVTIRMKIANINRYNLD